MKFLFEKLLDFVFPRHCLSCGEMNPQGAYKYLCSSCAKGPFAYQITRCKKCAEIVGSGIVVSSCAKCETENFFFNEAHVACEYAAAGRELVLELKYRAGFWVASDMAKITLASKNFEEYFKDSILVPVPISAKRRRSRGYNQSDILARAIAESAKLLNVRCEHLLKRSRHTDTQTALTRAEREENVKGAFEISGVKMPKDSRIIIVDDVITSGATLSECSKILKKAGFSDVRVFAFARRS